MTSNEINEVLNKLDECSNKKKPKIELKQEASIANEIKICVHFCEKKKRRCKFNALKNCDYCTWHDSFNTKVYL